MMHRLCGAAMMLAAGVAGAWAADDRSAGPATQPDGPAAVRWHYYTRCRDGELVAHEPGALWFRADMVLWRYDLKTRGIHSVSLLDGPLEEADKDAVLQPAGPLSLVNPLEFRDRVWLPGAGWTAVPGRSGFWGYHQVAFAPDGRLLMATGAPGGPRTVSELADGQWKEVATIPFFRDGFLPAAGGYFLFGTFKGDGVPMFVDGQGEPKDATPVGGARYMRRMIRVGDTIYGLFKREAKGETTWLVYEPVGTKLVERAAGPLVGIDLTGKGCFTGQAAEQEGGRVRYRIESPDGQAVQTPWLHREQAAVAFRDGSGELWLGGMRWDGKDWQAAVPIQHDFPLSSLYLAADPGRAVLDGQMIWREQPPGPGEGLAAWDPASRTGWAARPGKEACEFDLVRVEDGRRKVLFTHKSKRRTLEFLPVNGQWWWADDALQWGPGDGLVYRWKVGGTATYPSFKFGGTMGSLSAGGRLGMLCVSPKGRVWLRDNAGWSVCNERIDRFQSMQAGPWEEFAFGFGSWTLSRVGPRTDRVGPPWGDYHDQNIVYRKAAEGWRPFDPLKTGRAAGSPAMVRGDRMLVAYENVGVIEYAADRPGFVKLHDNWSFRPVFDSAGRRLLLHPQFVLVLEGDPFEAIAGQAARLDELLALMDDRSYQVRRQAAAEMAELAKALPEQVKAIWERRGELPPEVRWWLGPIVAGLSDQEVPQTGLFQRMHPFPAQR